MIDISVVLNAHDEDAFLHRTLRSLRDAIVYAVDGGLSVEVIAVLDRPSPGVRASMSDFSFGGMKPQIAEVDNGSLAASRNSGISLASGEYVTFADADDLVSFDSLEALHEVCCAGERVVSFPKYLMGFGASHHLTVYAPSHVGTPLSIVDFHPFTSRIMVRRSAFDDVKYATFDAKKFAFEDWHLNQDLTAAGYVFEPADCWLYYRQRPGSIMAQLRAQRLLPPPSKLFVPKTFVTVMKSAFDQLDSVKTRFQ